MKMPERPSSSSTTRTQSDRLAAQSCEASATLIPSGTVSAGDGLSEATVPFLACCCLLPRLSWRPPDDWLEGNEVVRLRESSDSIFLRIA